MDKATCRWPECDRPIKSFGLCNRDAQRARRCGNLVDPWRTWMPKRPAYGPECRWPECGRTDLIARGYCNSHYDCARRVGDFAEPWTIWNVSRECAWCGAGFVTNLRRDARCCSWSCGTSLWKRENADARRRHNRDATAARRARLRGVRYEPFTTDDLRARDGDDCYLCGELIDFTLRWPDPKSPSVDHVMPLARGGAHAAENAAMTHLACNLRKSTRVVAAP